jgi:hypothetical protein
LVQALSLRLWLLLLALLTLGSCVLLPASAQSSGNLALAGTAFCIDVPAASMVDGVRLALWSPCVLSAAQEFVYLSDFTIRPQAAQTLCMQGAPTQNAPLMLKTCSGSTNQQFSMLLSGPVVMRANPSYAIASNIYTIPANGVQMQITHRAGSYVIPDQHWQTPWTPAFGQPTTNTDREGQRVSCGRSCCCSIVGFLVPF